MNETVTREASQCTHLLDDRRAEMSDNIAVYTLGVLNIDRDHGDVGLFNWAMYNGVINTPH